MASPEKSKQKILKAKKTMPPSCRKQVEILKKSKNFKTLKTAVMGNSLSSDAQNSGTSIIINKCRPSENDVSSLESHETSQKSNEFSQNLVQQIDSKARLDYNEEQVVSSYQRPSAKRDASGKRFMQETKDSQNSSENHFEYQADITRSLFEQHKEDYNWKSTCCPSGVLNGVVQMPESIVAIALGDDRINNSIVSYLETNSNSESYDKRQSGSSDIHFVPAKLVSSVIFSNCGNDIFKSKESGRTCHPNFSNCEKTDSTWLSSLDTDRNNSHNQKKRMFSENKENVKRMKTTEQINENICVALEKQTALLEQVRHLIRQEICSINYKLFDNKLKELTERIGKTQCKNKHEAIADKLFAKIAKLQRRVKTVLSQRNCSVQNVLSSNTDCKETDSEPINLDKEQESVNNNPDERKTSVNSESSNLPEKASEKILSQEHESNNDDVMLISVESPNLTTPITSTPTDSGNSNSAPDAENKVTAVEKESDSVIDLTREGLLKYNTESQVSALKSPAKAAPVSKEMVPVAQSTAQVLEAFMHLPPLPEPPPPGPELVDKIRDTLPPQKPELRVKRVLRPRGIALTWNIAKINPKCAPVESYHIFLCHESPSSKLIWKKIGEIKALPLPMACTLSQFLASNKYYFTVQSKDIFGRYGPFCDIKSIPGFSESLT